MASLCIPSRFTASIHKLSDYAWLQYSGWCLIYFVIIKIQILGERHTNDLRMTHIRASFFTVTFTCGDQYRLSSSPLAMSQVVCAEVHCIDSVWNSAKWGVHRFLKSRFWQELDVIGEGSADTLKKSWQWALKCIARRNWLTWQGLANM